MTHEHGAPRAFMAAACVALMSSQAACSLAVSGLDAGPIKPCAPGSTIEFHDDFNDNMTGGQWIKAAGASITVGENPLEVQITSQGIPNAWGSYTWDGANLGTRSLLGCHVFIEVPQVLSDSDAATVYLSLTSVHEGEELSVKQTGGSIVFQGLLGKAPPHQVKVHYDAAAQRWWQIDESDGTVFWRTSPDGRTWTEQTSIQTPPFANAVIVSFGAGSDKDLLSGGTAVFDNLNTPP